MTDAEIIRVMRATDRPMTISEVFGGGRFDVSPASIYVALNKMSAPGGRGIARDGGRHEF